MKIMDFIYYLCFNDKNVKMEQVIKRNLPIGIQTFEKLRQEGYLYVDKTDFVWKMASTSTPYFLSLPPLFWKKLVTFDFRGIFWREEGVV